MSRSGPSPRKIKRVEEKAASSSDEDVLFDGMDSATMKALKHIDKCHEELDELNKNADKELSEIENKYSKLRKPTYDKRAALIDKIPNFWGKAIVNHSHISMLFDGKEENCLQFLQKLEVEEFDNVEDGYRIKFVFKENPFFENSELIKELQLGPVAEAKSTSTTIKWRKGMDLSKKQTKILDERRKRGLSQQTFFSWFLNNEDPFADDISELVRDDLWLNPLTYYMDADNGDEDDEDDSEDDDVY